jgi:iron(III) transport system permease protein
VPGSRSRWRFVGWGVVLIALVALVAWPLARLLLEGLAAGPGRMADAVGRMGLVAVWHSLWTSATVTVMAVAAGLGLALITERGAGGGRAWLRGAILLPLLVPDFVTAISWGRAYGPSGLGARLVGLELPGLYGPLGIVLVMSVGAVPLACLIIAAGMRVRAEPDLERAARVSGATRLAAFRSVTLPLLWPVLVAACGLVFVTSMNAFGTPAVLGRPAGFGTMTTRIYSDLAFSSSDAAFLRVIGLALLLVVVAIAVVALVDRVSPAHAERGGGSPGASLAPSRVPLPAMASAWAFVALGVAIPLLALVLTALTRAVGLLPALDNLTLANFGRAMDSQALGGLRNSLLLAAATATIAVALAFLGSTLFSGPRRRRLGTLVTLTFALPGSVLAVAVLLAFGASLRDTLGIILLAYLAKLWALAQRPVAAASERLPADLIHAARAHGAGRMTAARTVAIPLLAPVLAAAWLLVFVFALHEVTISVLLYGPGTATLAVVILNLQQLGDPMVTSALAVVLTGMVLAAVAALLVLRKASWTWVTLA